MEGPLLILKNVQLINQQSDEVREIVKPVVQRNAYLLEGGVMLCAMLSSSDRNLREKGLLLVSEAKRKPHRPKMKVLRGIRKLQIPKILWNATSWDSLVDMSLLPLSLPSIITRMGEDQFDKILDEPFQFPKLPLHSTSVERAVRLVSESSELVYGHQKRHSAILQKIKGRQIMPTFNNKGKFVISE